MSNFVASVIIRGVDQISGVARTVTNNFAAMKRSMEVSANVRKFAAETSMAASAISSFASKVSSVVDTPNEKFADFQHEMMRVKGLTQTTGVEFARLYNEALRLGSSIGEFSAMDAAKGMSEYGMAGYKTNQILAALPATLDLSTAAQVPLSDTIGITTGIMGAFGLKAEEINRVSDVLVSTFTNSKTTLRSLGETMSYAGSVAKAAGISLEETALMTGLLGDASIDGSRAGTSLNGIFAALTGGARGPGSKILAALGIQVEHMVDGTKKLRGPLDLLGELKNKLDGFSQAKQAGIIMRLFGREAAPGVQQLLSNISSDRIKELSRAINKAEGANMRLASTMRQTAKNATLEMNSAIEGLNITLGSQMAPLMGRIKNSVRDLTNTINELTKRFPHLSQGVMISLAAVAVLATGLTGLMWTISTVASGISVLIPVLGAMKTAWILAGVAASKAGVMTAIAWATALWPIALVVAGIATIAASAYVVYRYWDPIHAWLSNFWDRFTQATLAAKVVIIAVASSIAAPLIAVMAPLLAVPAAIIGIAAAIRNWDKIVVVAKNVWDTVSNIVGTSIDLIQNKVALMIDWISVKLGGLINSAPFQMALKALDIVTKPIQMAGQAASYVATGYVDAWKGAANVFTGGQGQENKWTSIEGEKGIWKQQSDVSGEIKISIDSEGRTKVEKIKSYSSAVDFDVDLGHGMSMVH